MAPSGFQHLVWSIIDRNPGGRHHIVHSENSKKHQSGEFRILQLDCGIYKNRRQEGAALLLRVGTRTWTRRLLLC